MATHRSESSGRSDRDRDVEDPASARSTRLRSTLENYARNGTIAVLAGAAVFVRGVRGSTRNEVRAGAQLALGAALLGVGLRQRRAGDGSSADEFGPSERDSEVGEAEVETEKPVADDARVARERADVTHQDETNPRGVTGEPDVETVTEADEGDVQFTTDGAEPRSKPDLDDETATDPRYNSGDETDDPVEIDLSEAAMADEASEATGPAPEQAEPAQVEDTEPDRSPPEDASHMQADVPDGSEETAADGSDGQPDE